MHSRGLLITVVLALAAHAEEPTLEWKYETTGKIYASPLIADLDGDGTSEIIVAASRDRRILCLDGLGQLLWSTELNDGHTDGLQATPSIVDYDGDGMKEIFAVAKGGLLACIEHDGDIRWQTNLHDEVDYNGPVLADINADGRIEIVLGSESGTLYCLDDTGVRLWHYQGVGPIRGIPAVGRAPQGATLRVYAAFSGGMLGCFDSEGNLVWRQDEPGPKAERRSGIALGDIDGDGLEEVVSATEDFTVIVANAATGLERWRWKGAHAIDQTNSFALADLDGSGRLDVLCGDGMGLSQPGNVYRLRDGQALWTADAGGGVLQGPSVADVDGDGRLDVLVCSRSQNLICLGDDGAQKWSYPTEAGCLTTPAIGDVDGDGQIEIVFTSKDRYVYCVSVGGAYDPAHTPWPNINGDLQLTGNAKPPTFVARALQAPEAAADPIRIEHALRDDLTTLDLTIHLANTEAWPRRLALTVSARNSAHGFIYTDENRFEAFQGRVTQIPVQVTQDGTCTIDIQLRDAAANRDIVVTSVEIPVNVALRINETLAALQNAYETTLSLAERRDLRDRASSDIDAAALALTNARDRLTATSSAPQRQKLDALAQAASAMQGARRCLARVAALERSGAGADGFAVLAESSLTKIFRDEPFESGTREARISLGRNESEAFQVVVVPLWQDLRELRVTINNSIIADANQQIQSNSVAPVGYIQIGTPEYSFPVDKLGEWPDVLLADEPLNIPAAQDAQPYWVTITTQPDTAPGVYRGSVLVEAAGCDPIELPLEVEVWDIELPEETTLKTSFWINERFIAKFYGYKGRLPWDLRKQWYNAHLERRVGPVMSFPLGGGDMEQDFDYLMSHGQNVLFVNVPHETDESKWPALAEQFATTRDMLEAKGWSDDTLLYSWDEVAAVGRHQIPEFVKMNTWLKETVPWWPRLETSAPEHALLGAVDVWCPLIDNFDPVLLADRKAQGERLWFYTVWGRPGIMIEFPATDHRLMFWECWKYGAEGFLYWGTTHWDLNLQTEARWPEIPWIPWNRQPGHNGCGYLLYPGPDGQPLSSIRLEVVRDGIEDYEYFHLLQTLVETAGAQLPAELATRAERELTVDPAVVMDNKNVTEDPQLLLEARRRIAQCILDIQTWLAKQ